MSSDYELCVQVAEARSDETFVALSLLTVTGASLLTQKLGFSDTMGAFVAGVLLAETNYSTQVLLRQFACIVCAERQVLSVHNHIREQLLADRSAAPTLIHQVFVLPFPAHGNPFQQTSRELQESVEQDLSGWSRSACGRMSPMTLRVSISQLSRANLFKIGEQLCYVFPLPLRRRRHSWYQSVWIDC